MKKALKYAFLDSLGTALYIILVASLIYFLNTGNFDNTRSVIIPITMLMLLVFSAAIVGSLIFGRPILWYMEGNKKEAISLLLNTLGIFLVFTLIAVFVLLTII
ncbi:hypothetical protein CO038_04330 [Candidatus Pacearchaeota archaeon CG_4_9_14_0_2_um_filter_39_13]|nr:hypothetical protein [Candidatus Pacearchaeota archaeon]OIO42741.1 MAG: hypothetical protein AUJ64_03640 [Candidatus Pacearchaeota archaeon CG1_02_39_14]PJC44296.1 MAG: hypothetical protein CO038_04330 [Candidatus Pacearchaeota archaeon CG_4_9_14_0_2_um_filter_39_13]